MLAPRLAIFFWRQLGSKSVVDKRSFENNQICVTIEFQTVVVEKEQKENRGSDRHRKEGIKKNQAEWGCERDEGKS